MGASLFASTEPPPETVYRFTAGDCDVRMVVEFLDRYSTKSLWFKDQLGQQRFCVSGAGEENRNCLTNFVGAIAIARYHIESRAKRPGRLALREYVRTIDQDARLVARAPFERTIELRDGVASDIQAFGYQPDSSSAANEAEDVNGPWCLFRQDLHLEGEESLFLVLHWKHTLNAIRLFDVIPGERTRLVSEPQADRGRLK